MSFLKQIKKFQKKIELYGFLGAVALLFLAPGCGSDNSNNGDDVQPEYGAAVFTCTTDADCVQEYGDGFTCNEDSECVDENDPQLAYGPAPS